LFWLHSPQAALKEDCKAMNLPVSGTVANLRSRLQSSCTVSKVHPCYLEDPAGQAIIICDSCELYYHHACYKKALGISELVNLNESIVPTECAVCAGKIDLADLRGRVGNTKPKEQTTRANIQYGTKQQPKKMITLFTLEHQPSKRTKTKPTLGMPAASKQSNLVAGLQIAGGAGRLGQGLDRTRVCSWITLRHCLSYDFRVLCCYCCSGSIYYSY
jgi:hypothetical protein